MAVGNSIGPGSEPSCANETTPRTNEASRSSASGCTRRGGLLGAAGWHLWFASPYDKKNIAGYVKTHHVRLLRRPRQSGFPTFPARHRTSISVRRLTAMRATYASSKGHLGRLPYREFVRLEFAGTLSLQTFAPWRTGLPKVSRTMRGLRIWTPALPQNLQPIAALETRLRHLLGDAALAERAVRDSVALINN